MIRISEKQLNDQHQNLLNSLQQRVNEEGDFFARVEKAKQLWIDKAEIKQRLIK